MKKDIAIYRTDESSFEIQELIGMLTKFKDVGGTSVDMYSSYDGDFEMVIHAEVEMTDDEWEEFNKIKYRTIELKYTPRSSE